MPEEIHEADLMQTTRRSFLKQVAAGAVVLGPSRFAWAQAERMPQVISFGYSLYGMRNLTLEAGLEACAKIGYDAVELALMPGHPSEPRRLNRDERRRVRERLRTLRLGLPALMENLPLHGNDEWHRANLKRLQAALDLGADLAPDAPPVIETILGGSPGQWDKLRRRFADRLGDWARLAEKHKTIVAVKPHRSNAMNLPAQALWLLEQIKSPWIKLDYDYSHFQHRELSIAETVKSLLPHTCFVHIKDTRLENGRPVFVLPGDGGVDYAELLRAIAASGYRGCVCVEVSGMVQNQKAYDALAAARRSYANVAPAFTKAGVHRH